MNEKEMMERYIYEVIRRVPQASREEIRLELQSLIEDMHTKEGASMEEVLKKLGDPAEFAKRYREDTGYVIGPQYYDNYMWVLKLALIGIGISVIVSAFISAITNAGNWGNLFTILFSTLISTGINGIFSAVGVVTIIFFFFEWQHIKIDLKKEKNWSVDELSKNAVGDKIWSPLSLPPVPDKRALISRSDSIFGIIFVSTFAALLWFAPELFGAFHYDGDTLKNIACIFNLNEWNRILPVILLFMFSALADEIIRLITGYHCKPVMYSRIIADSLQIICAVILLKVLPLWNPDFAEQIKAIAGINSFSDGDILRFLGSSTFNNILLTVICIISICETAVTIYKTQKYS